MNDVGAKIRGGSMPVLCSIRQQCENCTGSINIALPGAEPVRRYPLRSTTNFAPDAETSSDGGSGAPCSTTCFSRSTCWPRTAATAEKSAAHMTCVGLNWPIGALERIEIDCRAGLSGFRHHKFGRGVGKRPVGDDEAHAESTKERRPQSIQKDNGLNRRAPPSILD